MVVQYLKGGLRYTLLQGKELEMAKQDPDFDGEGELLGFFLYQRSLSPVRVIYPIHYVVTLCTTL